jgi:uncharacterized coiled-coil protein SlyX
VNNTIRPIRTFAFLEQTDSSKYIIDLEAWCDNIEQLHANQASNIAGYQADVAELNVMLTNALSDVARLTTQADNVTDGLIEANRTIAELRAMNETQMTRINELLARIEGNEIVITTIQGEVEARQNSIDIWKADLAIIREELESEAEHRDWCSEYRDFAKRVNDRLTVALIGPELRTFKVLHEYRVTLTGEVLAKDLNEAHDLADRQYGGIRESVIFSLPDDSEDALNPDRGELHSVRWSHQTTDTIEAEGNDW